MAKLRSPTLTQLAGSSDKQEMGGTGKNR